MNMLSPILEAQNLHVIRAGAHLLDIPSLTLHEGEILSLIGPNGAGKTTLLQTLAYLLRSFQGEIYFKGRKVDSDCPVFEYRRKLAMVFQEPLLFDTTVFNNVATGPRLRGIEKKEIHRQVMENLDRFGIGHLVHRSARTLSGGEAQRTSLARAFAIKPEILFLDEPFVSLDPPSRESLVEDLQRVLRETRTTTVFATHDRMEALRLSDRIAVMNGGKILQIGSSDGVMNHPVNEFVASFVGVETILTGNVVKKDGGIVSRHSFQDRRLKPWVQCAWENRWPCASDRRMSSFPSTLNGEVTSARNVFPGKVIRVTPMGLFHRVHLDCGFPLVAYVTSHSLENLSLAEGKQVRAFFKATAIHVVRRKERQRE